MANVSGYLIGVLVFVLGVGLSIALHEIGHLVPAKLFGVRCTQYMVGFGATLWSRRIGETEYGVKAIPLGGYVRMLGMFPPKPGRPVQADTTGRWSLLIEQARADAVREVSPDDAQRLFYQRPVWKRMIIMLGGPTMNLILASIVIALVYVGYGLPQSTTTVDTVSRCVIPVNAPAGRTCQPGDPAAPAAQAGLRPGDAIVAFAGKPVTSWDEVRTAIRANHGTPVQVVVRRGGTEVPLTITPRVEQREKMGPDGNPVIGPDGKRATEAVGFLGVTPGTTQVRQPWSSVPGAIGDTFTKVAGVVLRIPQKMVGVMQAAFGSGERDPNGPISIVGAGRLAGEIGSAQGTADHPVSVLDRVMGWVTLLGSINMALFVFNLIPLLPLDGGHVIGALWEGLRRRVARLLRRPDPGPVDVARALPLAYGVATVLIGMSVLLVYADIVRPIKLGG